MPLHAIRHKEVSEGPQNSHAGVFLLKAAFSCQLNVPLFHE